MRFEAVGLRNIGLGWVPTDWTFETCRLSKDFSREIDSDWIVDARPVQGCMLAGRVCGWRELSELISFTGSGEEAKGRGWSKGGGWA